MQSILQSPILKEFSEIFSYILTAKDCIATDDTVLKDVAKFLPTRSKETIIIIDTNQNDVDNDVSAFIF